MTQRKKLIEVALPLEAINVASAREKSIRHGHPSTLHLWWARRPLAAARAVIFSSLVDDPDSPDALPAFVEACKQLPKGKNAQVEDTPRQRLFDFIERLVTWEATTNEAILNKARELIMIATEGNPPPLLDPFAGGGSIPLEAQRLGLEAHASDLNPVAVMINKAQIEIPPRFANMPPVNPRDRAKMFGEGQPLAPTPNSRRGKENKSINTTWKGAAGLAADVRYYGEWMREKAWEKIGHLYPKHNGETVIAWLWARTVKSPNPAVNAHVPLVRSFILSKKKGRERWAKPIIEGNAVRFEVAEGLPPKDEDGNMNRTGGVCLISGEPIPLDYIKAEGLAGKLSVQLMAIVTDGRNGRDYYSPDNQQQETAFVATPIWIPEYEMSTHSQYMAPPRYGMTKFSDLFTQRQLVGLATFSELIPEVMGQVKHRATESGMLDSEEYSRAIATYLSLNISKLADLGNALCPWEPVAECPRNLFGRQLVSMTWNFAEGNFFSSSSGSWKIICDNFERNTKSYLKLSHIQHTGEIVQRDAQNLKATNKFVISTDPPYYDNVPYADLSDFFYVWLRKTLGKIYPEIFSTMLVPKKPELVADIERWETRENANQHFETGLKNVFGNIRNATLKNYPVSVFYAFKQSEDSDSETNGSFDRSGWETMLEGIVKAGFNIIGTWPMRTELTRALKTNMNFLASSIVLVCRPRAENAANISRRAFVDALRRELPAALKEMQSGNIAPVDLAQASIGPGMAIYSRYSKVLEADGSAMSVRMALGLINQELDAYLAEQDGEIDGDTRFAVAWFEQFGFTEGEFGQADVLARAKNTSVAGVEAAGIVKAARGKVRLRRFNTTEDDFEPSWNPTDDKRATVWEATHHLIERLNTHGEKGSAMLMMQLPHDMAAEARSLAYRLYSICERKGWADHARDYNALVISWAEIGDVSAQLREAKAQGEATEQRRLFED